MGVLYPDDFRRPYYCQYGRPDTSSFIISLGVGWLALLILETGQCEGLIAGIGAEEITPTPFLFPDHIHIIINAG